jgi:6-phosphogluconolactonase
MDRRRSAVDVRVLPGPGEVAREGAALFVSLARSAVEARGAFHVALPGGEPGRRLCREIAQGGEPPHLESVPWEGVRFYFTDERPGPAEHPENSYRIAYEALLSRIPLRPGNVIRFFSEGPDLEFVVSYTEQLLQEAFELAPGAAPRFDLVLLALGPRGEVAGLPPGAEVPPGRLAAAPRVEALGGRRLTLTPFVLRAARVACFLATGEETAEAARAALETEAEVPARLVRPEDGEVVWLLDREAARLLSRTRARENRPPERAF